MNWRGGSFVAVVALVVAGAALADYPVRDGNGVLITIKAFVCDTTKVCALHVPAKSNGTELFTLTDPGHVDATQSTVPWVTSGYATNTASLASWTSATAANTNIDVPNSGFVANTMITLTQGTLTVGAVTFRAKDAAGNYVALLDSQVRDCRTLALLTNPYTLVSGATQSFCVLHQGYTAVNVQLTTQITGAGTVVVSSQLVPYQIVDPGILNPIAAGTATIGKVGIDQANPATSNAVQAIPGTTGGTSTTGNIAANNTTAVVVKASAGMLYGAQLYGIGSAPAYLKLYNATSATCGSGTPVKRLMIPAAATAANGAGSNVTFGDVGVAFGTGITYCVTTGIGDADATAPAANTYLVNLDWK